MFSPIKKRTIDDSLILFFENLKIDDEIQVPYLSDGTFELLISQNNQVSCVPINSIFENLWNLLLSKPSVLSLMIQRCDDAGLSTEYLLKHKNKLVSASSLINLCRRSKEEVLMNNSLEDKDRVFDLNFHNDLKKFKTNMKLINKTKQGAVFQDLSYLDETQKQTLVDKSNCLLVTNNEKDLNMFKNFEQQPFKNYYLLWSKK